MSGTTRYAFEEFLLEATERRLSRVTRGPIDLTGKPFDLLVLLVENPGRLMTRDVLRSRIWGDTEVTDQSLTEAVSRVRKALDPKAPERYVETVSRQGYRFVAPVRAVVGGDIEPGAVSPLKRRNQVWIAAAATVVLVGALLGLFWRSFNASSTGSNRLYQRALTLERGGNDALAIDSLKEALALNPKNARASLRAAWILYQDDRNEEALKYALQVLASRKNASDPIVLKANALVALLGGDLDTAQRNLELALQSDPGDIEAVEWIVENQINRGDLDGASRHVSQCLQLDVTYPFCQYQHLELLIRKSDFDHAQRTWQEAEQATHGYPWLHELAGYLELGAGRTDSAVTEFQILEKLGRQLANEVHFRASQEGLAQVALLEENFAKAHDLIQGAISVSPSTSDRASYLIYLGGIDALANKPAEAESHIEDALSVSRSDEQTASAMRILAFSGQLQKARELEAQIKNPSSLGTELVATKSFLKGVELFRGGQDNLVAIDRLKEAQYQDADPIFTFILAHAQIANHDCAGAQSSLRRLLDEKGVILLDSYASLIPAATRDLHKCTQR